jgi:hypothetical protein
LRIGAPDHASEREADRVANEVMSGGTKPDWSLSRMGVETSLRRKCACGGSGASGGECEDCNKEKTLQRKPAAPVENGVAPQIVHEVLASPGHPLDFETRRFFERRFAHDFSKVRVHSDARAGASARAINAFAYTVGNDVAMGNNQYAPHTEHGKRLLAHELVHTIQQNSSPRVTPATLLLDNPSSHAEQEAAGCARMTMSNGNPAVPRVANRPGRSIVARACFTKEVCEAKSERTPEQLLTEETSKPENKSKRDTRKAACTKKPHADASCKADGHGARAVEAEKVLRGYDATRLKFIKQIVVDKDMESGFGGLTGECSGFMPPIRGGGLCTFIPDRIETEAAQFNNTMDPTIGGRPRDVWRDRTLSTLMHETEHARFDATTIAAPSKHACKFDAIQDALSEIAAMLEEFPVIFRSANENVTFTPEKRKQVLDRWFEFRITDDQQSFKSTLHSIYCACACDDAAAYVKKTIEFTTASWSQTEKARLHGELQDPKWADQKLLWPVAPPAAQSSSGGAKP